MTLEVIPLPEVDEVKVTTIVDNNIDLLLPSNDVVERYPLSPRFLDGLGNIPNPWDQAVAEHGYSALIQVKQGEKRGTVLYDTGVSRYGILRNFDSLEIVATDIQAITISHGHPDHSMGLMGLIDRLGTRGLPLILHPDAFLQRRVVLPDGYQLNYPAPLKSDFRREDIEVIEETGPSMLVDGMLLVSGEIARNTHYEVGNQYHHSHRNDAWVPDPLIIDDQCVIANLRGKGLVVITGCGHSGIINTVQNAQKLTGVDKVHAVLGGFHLTGRMQEPYIAPTIAALRAINPTYVMPGHCTGWLASQQIALAMPDAYVASCVGTSLNLT